MATKKAAKKKNGSEDGSKTKKVAKKKPNDPRILVIVNNTDGDLNVEMKGGAFNVAKGKTRKFNARTPALKITPMSAEGSSKGLPNKELQQTIPLKKEGHRVLTVSQSGGKLRITGKQYWPTDRDQFMGKAKKDGVKVR